MLREKTAKKRAVARRKRFAHNLIQGSDALQAIVSTVPAGLLICDRSGSIIMANPTANALLGGMITGDAYGPDGGYSLHNLDGSPFRAENLPLPKAIDYGEITKEAEILIRHPDGRDTIILATGSPIYDSTGNITGAVAIFQDITGRRQTEKELERHRDHLDALIKERSSELKAANVRLRRITDNMLDMITQTDTGGNIEYFSPSARKTLGYSADELVGKSIFTYVHPADVERVVTGFRKFISGSAPAKIHFRYRHADGHYLWLETVGSLLFDNHYRVTGTILSTRDITERKHLEKEMARLDKLDLVGETAVGIGHEIRNPLTAVRGFLQIMQNKTDLNEYREYISIMIDELDRANSIIKEFLSLAKDKAIYPKRVNLNRVIENLCPLIEAEAILANQSVVTELAEIPDLLLDEKEICQLILNLTRNGLEAMPEGSSLLIRTFCDGKKAVLSVKDSGSGIAPEALEKLGTPFFTTKEHGTGLGLAVCYSIAVRHEATIEVETGPDGTTFSVRFTAT